MYPRILVPTDGSAFSDRAVEHAVRLARATGAKLVFLFVMDTLRSFNEGVMPEIRRELEAQGAAVVARAQHFADIAGVPATGEVLEGSPPEVIVRRAQEFDLVVMGSHGKGFWKRLAMGSVTQAVLRAIARPLLVVPSRERAPA